MENSTSIKAAILQLRAALKDLEAQLEESKKAEVSGKLSQNQKEQLITKRFKHLNKCKAI